MLPVCLQIVNIFLIFACYIFGYEIKFVGGSFTTETVILICFLFLFLKIIVLFSLNELKKDVNKHLLKYKSYLIGFNMFLLTNSFIFLSGLTCLWVVILKNFVFGGIGDGVIFVKDIFMVKKTYSHLEIIALSNDYWNIMNVKSRNNFVFPNKLLIDYINSFSTDVLMVDIYPFLDDLYNKQLLATQNIVWYKRLFTKILGDDYNLLYSIIDNIKLFGNFNYFNGEWLLRVGFSIYII